MKRLIRIIPVVLFSTLLILATLEPVACAETKVTVTIAGTTVVGGAYIVFYLTLGHASDFRQLYHINDALLNMDSKGWRAGMPFPWTVRCNGAPPHHHVNLMKIMF